MNIEDILEPGSVIANLHATSKKQVLQELSKAAGEILKTDARQVFDILVERERLGSTGVGSGLVIPHGKLPGLDHLQGVFARLEKPVDFDSIDDEPVDLVFLLLAPEGAGADHLKALAGIARLFREAEVVNKLRASSDKSALYAVLTEGATPDAA